MTVPVDPHEPLFNRKAALQLNFLIVGASMGGLACAYNLVHAGHKVRILERADGVAKVRFFLVLSLLSFEYHPDSTLSLFAGDDHRPSAVCVHLPI